MKLFFKRALWGFALSTVVGICVHFRGEAIQNMPPIEVTEKSEGGDRAHKDFMYDVKRVLREDYAPIRPLSKEGSFLLDLEMFLYATPEILATSTMSPLYFTAFIYPETLRQDHRRRMKFGGALPESIGASARAEGAIWGLIQGAAFYVPFVFRWGKKAKSKNNPTIKPPPIEQTETEPSQPEERSVLDSAIDKL